MEALALFCISPEARGKTTVAQNWIGAWNSADPEKLVAAFTPDAVYEDVAFGIIRRAARSYATCTNSSTTPYHAYVELVDSHVADGHGTIEWVFGGTDVDVFKTGKPCSVRGVSVIEVSDGRISRNLDYYDAAAIMRQVGVLPEQKNDRRG